MMPFPADFVWGTATSSYQVEGAALEDGRGECIWTRFSHQPGTTHNGETGDVACDHYHRYPKDVALMRKLGFGAYRFSISWARVLPLGTGRVNEAGLDFYDQLVDVLLEAGIQPFPTLYHWDLPQALQDKGGWANPAIPDWFAQYCDVVARKLGDRITSWMTLNEPWCTAFQGHLDGILAPGLRDERIAFEAAHYSLLAHACAVPVLRQYNENAQVGIALNLSPFTPATDDPDDVRLAHRADGLMNRWFLDPIYRGVYPADVATELLSRGILTDRHLRDICAAAVPIDFLGINYYMRWVVRHTGEGDAYVSNAFPPDAEFTDMNWEIYPAGLTEMLRRVHADYGPRAIYITECGAAFREPATISDPILEDPQRIAFLQGYLAAAADAVDCGVPLKGFFVWSLLDNYEWANGFSKRFGIIHVDHQSQRRTLKRSALYLREVMQTGRL